MNTSLDFCMALQGAHASLQGKLDFELGLHHGIGFADFVLLDAIDRADGGRLGTAQLVRPLGQTRSSVLRQVIVLEKIGLVAREDGHGGRQVALRPAGRGVLQGARETAGYICNEAFASLTPTALTDAGAALAVIGNTPALSLAINPCCK